MQAEHQIKHKNHSADSTHDLNKGELETVSERAGNSNHSIQIIYPTKFEIE